MENKDTFSGYNPLITFLFFIGAVVFGMFFVHPAFLACSFLLAFAYYITVRGARGFRFLFGMLPQLIQITVVNTLYNT